MLTRREFLKTSLAGTAALTTLGVAAQPSATGLASCPVVVFSKIYQELNLSLSDAAELTKEAGLDGVDSPVRPGGEILPERVTEDLPRYLQILSARGLTMPLITSGITSVRTPYAEQVLRAAKQAGVHYYRLGFFERNKAVALETRVREIKAQLRELCALNREVRISALFQNHSGSFGADLDELWLTVKDFDPAELGIAFDIGHALVVHGDQWRKKFDQLKSHLKIAYVKDSKRLGSWVPFGQGDIAQSGYFGLLKELKYRAPLCLHIEYDWSNGGRAKDRATLLSNLRSSTAVLKQWLAKA